MHSLTPYELKHWIDEGKDFVLIDVREQFERDAFNIGGEHIPLGDLMVRREELKHDKPVVIYCEKGIRSGMVIQRLEPLGYEHLYNLSGGMSAWKQQVK